MNRKINRKCSLTIGILITIAFAALTSNAQTPKKITVGEMDLRKNAIKKVVPNFPPKALKAKASGVAVAQINISEDGLVLDVQILESPHKSIDLAMIEALKQWKFYSFYLKGKPQKVTGKITFYFVIENQRGGVESPFKDK